MTHAISDDSEETFEFIVDEEQVHDFLGSDSDHEKKNVQEEDWLHEFDLELGMAKETKSDVAENLAKIINVLKTRLPSKKAKAKFEKILRPGNTSMLVNPHVNQQIWLKPKHDTRTKAIKLSQLGERIAKGLVAAVKVIEWLSKLLGKVPRSDLKEVKEITKANLEAVQVGGDGSSWSSPEIKYVLNAVYRMLCNAPTEECEELFGKNLAEHVKELNEAQCMGRQLADAYHGLGSCQQKSYHKSPF